MPERIVPRPVEIGPACSIGCSLNGRRLPIADLVTQWFSAGLNNEVIVERARAAGSNISLGAVGRHRRRHLVLSSDEEVAGIRDASVVGGEGDRVDHVKVLEAIIARGARSIHTWRVGPDMTIKAMDMWYKLTQGNAQQAWMDEMAQAIAGLDPDPVANPNQQYRDELAAVRDADEPSVASEGEIEAADGAA